MLRFYLILLVVLQLFLYLQKQMLEDKMKITIIATGFANSNEKFIMPNGTAKVEEPKVVEPKKEELPEIAESNVNDDEISEIINMLRKSKENK